MNPPNISPNNKMLFFIRAKHWQLFLLIWIPSIWSSHFPFAILIRSIGALLFLGWLASVGIYGTDIINKKYFQRSNRLFFLCILLAPLLTAIYISYCWPMAIAPYMPAKTPPSTTPFPYIPLIAFMINVALTFTVVYIFCYVAKTIAVIEKQRNVKLSEWIKYSVFIILFILGFWILQPKVNRWLQDQRI